MTAHNAIGEFEALLEYFVKGTSTTPWKVIVEQLHGPQLRKIQAAGDDREAADECWQILCTDQFADQVLDFYTPSVPFEGDKELVDRLVRNARALFATACAAEVARDCVSEDQHALLLEWYRRAVAVLDPVYATAPSPLVSNVAPTTETDDLIQWACDTVGASSAAAYCARVWCLWWQDRLVTSNEATRQTWLAWTLNNHGDAGSLEVTETDIPFAALVEHPDVALIPAHEDWLNTIERAWHLSNCATLGRTVFWRVQLPNAGGLILKHTSAGGGFYVALSCLRDRRASDPSRAILAALPDDGATAPQLVASVDRKIDALVRSNVKSFAVAEGQTWHPHAQVEIVKCRSLDDSVEFMSGLATQLRAFAISIAESTPAQTETYIEPILFKTQALNITRVDRVAEDNSANAIDLDIGMSGWSALAPLLNGSARSAVLIADSGFGKTALVEWLAGRLAKSSLDFFEQPKTTFESRPDPFVLPLKANHLLTAIVADRSSQSSQETTEFDDESARRLLVRAAVTRYRDHEQAISYVVDCAAGARHNLEALIVVDGLDAVRAERRRLMSRFLGHISNWNCRILLTGREYAFDASQVEGATIYRIREFTPQQTRRYVEQSLGPEKAQSLLRLFNSSPTSRLFARVPLLLSMICRGVASAEQNSRNALEAAARKFQFDDPTRTTLYRELFLDRLGQDDAMVLADQRLQVLANMSVKWLKESGAAADVLERDVIAWIGTDRIRAIPIGANSSRIVNGEVDPPVVATTLLENFVSVGILSPTKDRKSYRATHPSFNEYLAGRGLAVRINCRDTDAAAAAAAADDVMLHLLDPSWRGVTPFVAGELDDPLQMLSKIELDPDPFHLKLFTVVKWLAEIKPNSALEADVTQVTRRLIDLLGSRSLLDRDRAIEAIGEIGIGWHNVIAPLLTPLLNHSKPNLQAAALEAACLLNLPPAIERATEYVRNPSRKGRERVLRRLAAIDPLAGVKAARELIDDRVLAVRATATDILLTYGGSVDTLIAQLRDTNSINRELASKALSTSESSETANRIRALLHDEEEYTRVIAIKTLASLDVPWLMSAIGEMVTDASVDVRIETASALGRIGSAEALAKLQTMLADDVVAPSVLDGFSAANALPGLDADLLLNHRSPVVQLRAASLYHKHGVGKYLPRLLDEVSSGSSDAFFALEQLAELKDPESAGPLIDLLTDSPMGIQSMIAEALGKIGARKAVRPLIELLQSDDSINRIKAVEALGQIGDSSAVTALIERIGDDNVTVRRAAVRALGALGDPNAIGPLLEVITWNDDLTAEATKALASFATLPQLLSSLSAAGGLLAVAQKSAPAVVYELLWSLVVAAQPNLWAGDEAVLGELTNSVARSQAVGSHFNKR